MLNRRDFLAAASAALVFMPGRAEAAGIEVLGAFNVPKGLDGSSRKISLAARPGKSAAFAALWEQDTGETYEPSYARYYAGPGKTEGKNVKLLDTTYSGSNCGTMIVNRDGTGLAFTFGYDSGGDLDLWWVQRLSADGKPVGRMIKLGDGLSGDMLLADRLPNGNVLAAWRGSGSGNNFGRVVSPLGTIVAKNDGGLCNGPVEAIAAMPNGGGVAAYYGPDLKASFQRLTPGAGRTGQPIAVPSVYSFGGMTVASHPQGFVGVWKNEDAVKSPTMEGAIFSTAGTRVATLAAQKLRPAGSEDLYRDLGVVALSLPNGRVVVAADSVRRPDPNGYERFYEVIVYLYASTGALLAKKTVYSKRAETELWPYLHKPRSMVQLGDGSILLGIDSGYDFGIQTARAIQLKV